MHNYIDSPIEQNHLSFKLKPVFIGQLVVLNSLHNPAFTYKNGEFQIVLKANEGITSEFVANYATRYSKDIYIYEQDYRYLNTKLTDELTKLTRSLSIGEPLKNSIKQVNLLTMQMANLYSDPFNDELLNKQYQHSKTLFSLLQNNKKIHKSLFYKLSGQTHHYTHTQPLLSAILLNAFSQSIPIFSEKDLQNLFLTSYFKDIGMSFIPREKFELSNLNTFDKKLFADHAENSMKILDGRVPFSRNQLRIIQNHHYLNFKMTSEISGVKDTSKEEFLSGIESTLISTIDIFVAMTSARPYREALSPFQALELIKNIISDDYPQEFKLLVVFLKNFFKK